MQRTTKKLQKEGLNLQNATVPHEANKRERKTLVKKSSKVFKKIDFQNDDQMFEDAPNINFK
jgi:hypothetical protein